MLGKTISHYKILEKLGEGGMGVVYKAEDTKLDRTVALKFLPPNIAPTEAEKKRFIHEAKAASSLDHPNICTVYEIDETPDGQMFLAMAFYEGAPLSEKIKQGPLKINEAIETSIQAAEGLQAAHEKGITHRDIKSGNLILTEKGQVKLMDFGLAKSTGASMLTKSGATVGTVPYMSPEQARGEKVDHRTDIWALGVVLYEMIAGRLPFQSAYNEAIVYSIMNEEPAPLTSLRSDVPMELERIVKKCLQKDSGSRYQRTEDFLVDLRTFRKSPETNRVGTRAQMETPRSKRRWILFGGIAAMIIIMAALGVLLYLNQPRRMPLLNPNRKITILPLPTTTLNYSRLSHDGNWIAFAGADNNGKWHLYYMNSAGGDIRKITNDTIHSVVSVPGVSDISRDGATVLFYRSHPQHVFDVAVVPSLGGTIRTLTPGMMAKFVDGHDNILYFKLGSGVGLGEQLWSMKLDGSNDHLVFKDTLAPYGFVSFSTSPEGKSFAWIRTSPDYSGDLVIVDLESGVERQATFTKTMKDEVFWTRDNFLIYSSFANNNFDLWISPAEGGEPQPLTVSLQDEVQAQLSDDGKKMLYYERSFFGNIKALDLETGNTTSITNDDKRRRSLIVSPDGRYFVYSRNARSGRRYFLQTELVGYDRTLEKPEWTIVKEKGIGLRSWSHDGKWIAYVSIPDSIGRGFKLCIVSPFDGSRPRVLAVGTEMRSLYWLDEQRVGWFADMKTWVCSIDKPEPRQFYQDSTIAFSVQNGRYVLFQDLRVGRLGWWLADVTSPSSSTSRILIDAAELLWWPFVLTTTPNQTLQKISLPGGKKENLKVKIPSNWVNLRMSADLKTLYGIEIVSTSNLILWENPFIWE